MNCLSETGLIYKPCVKTHAPDKPCTKQSCVSGLFCNRKPVQAARESSILPRWSGGKRGGATALAELPFGGRQAASFLHLLLNLLRGQESLSSFKACLGRTIQHNGDCLWKRFSKQLNCFLYFSLIPFQEFFLDKCCYGLGCIGAPAGTVLTDVWARDTHSSAP